MNVKNELKDQAAYTISRGGEIAAARFLGVWLFLGVKDKGGDHYFNHLDRVAGGVAEEFKAIAYLHDVLEDIPEWTIQDLKDIGFSARTIEGVLALTKNAGHPYFDEMVRIGMVPQAIPVKRSDLRDNSNLLRLSHLPQLDDIKRVRKYFMADRYLRDIEEKKFQPGTLFAAWMAAQPENRQDWDLFREYSSEKGPWKSPVNTPAPSV